MMLGGSLISCYFYAQHVRTGIAPVPSLGALRASTPLSFFALERFCPALQNA